MFMLDEGDNVDGENFKVVSSEEQQADQWICNHIACYSIILGFFLLVFSLVVFPLEISLFERHNYNFNLAESIVNTVQCDSVHNHDNGKLVYLDDCDITELPHFKFAPLNIDIYDALWFSKKFRMRQYEENCDCSTVKLFNGEGHTRQGVCPPDCESKYTLVWSKTHISSESFTDTKFRDLNKSFPNWANDWNTTEYGKVTAGSWVIGTKDYPELFEMLRDGIKFEDQISHGNSALRSAWSVKNEAVQFSMSKGKVHKPQSTKDSLSGIAKVSLESFRCSGEVCLSCAYPETTPNCIELSFDVGKSNSVSILGMQNILDTSNDPFGRELAKIITWTPNCHKKQNSTSNKQVPPKGKPKATAEMSAWCKIAQSSAGNLPIRVLAIANGHVNLSELIILFWRVSTQFTVLSIILVLLLLWVGITLIIAPLVKIFIETQLPDTLRYHKCILILFTCALSLCLAGSIVSSISFFINLKKTEIITRILYSSGFVLMVFIITLICIRLYCEKTTKFSELNDGPLKEHNLVYLPSTIKTEEALTSQFGRTSEQFFIGGQKKHLTKHTYGSI